MAYELYQLPLEVAERLLQEKSTTSSMYRGQEFSDSPYEYTRDTARKLFEHHGYRAVARFNVDSLGSVHPFKKNSVFVGDIVRDLDTNLYYIVNPMGFDHLKRLRRKV